MKYIERDAAIRAVLKYGSQAAVAAVQDIPSMDLVADRNKLKDKLILNICSHCDSRFDYCGECPIIKDINEAFDEQ